MLLVAAAFVVAASLAAAGPVPPRIQGFSLADVQVRGSGSISPPTLCCPAYPGGILTVPCPAIDVPYYSSFWQADRCPAPPLRMQLAEGSEFLENHEQNNRFLLLLDPDNLLYNFRYVGFKRWGALLRSSLLIPAAAGPRQPAAQLILWMGGQLQNQSWA